MVRNLLSKLKNTIFPQRPVTSQVNTLLEGTDFHACDVGAAKWLLPHWQVLEEGAFFYLVEPCQSSAKELQATIATKSCPQRYQVLPYALSGTGGRRTLYITNCETGSSIVPITDQISEQKHRYLCSDYFFPVTEKQIDTISLADLINNQIPQGIDLLKLDTQGSELEILSGAQQAQIQHLTGLELEINLFRNENGHLLFDQVVQFANAHDLTLFDLRTARVHLPHKNDRSFYQKQVFNVVDTCPYISGRIHEVDAIFFTNQDKVLEEGSIDKIRKLVVAYCVYHYFNEAYALVVEAQAKELIDADLAQQMTEQVKQWFKAHCPRFIYKNSSWAAFSRRALRSAKLDPTQHWARHLWVDSPNT